MKFAEVEHISATLRVFDANAVGYGDKYEFCMTLRWISPDVVELVGLRREQCVCGITLPNPISYRKEICDCLRKIGVDVIFWKKYKNDIPTEIYMDTRTTKLIKNYKEKKMVKLTRLGSGYYRVFVDKDIVSQHIDEREAIERSIYEMNKNPNSEVFYDHDYKVVCEKSAK